MKGQSSSRHGYRAPSMMGWESRTAKRHADDIAFRAMVCWMFAHKGRKPKSILSLPAADWLWEQSFTNTFHEFRLEFHGVERDKSVHNAMRLAGLKLDCLNARHRFKPHPYPSTAAEFLSDYDGAPLDMVYLDWMVTWSEDKLDELDLLFRQKKSLLSKQSLLKFTIALGRGNKAKWHDVVSDYSPSMFQLTDIRGTNGKLPEWKVYGVPGLVIDTAAAAYGIDAKVLSAAVYLSHPNPRERGTAEASFLLQLRYR